MLKRVGDSNQMGAEVATRSRRPPERGSGFNFQVVAVMGEPTQPPEGEELWRTEVKRAHHMPITRTLAGPELEAVDRIHEEFLAAVIRAIPQLTLEQKRLLTADPVYLEQTLVALAKRWPVEKGPMPAQDVIIAVSRTTPIEYGFYIYQPQEKSSPLHPDLEMTGPDQYGLGSIEVWHHPLQLGNSVVSAKEVHSHLVSSGLIERTLSFRDGQEIKKIPVEVFRQFFQHKVLFLYRSVIKTDYGHYLPYLCDAGECVEVRWVSLEKLALVDTPAALFGGK